MNAPGGKSEVPTDTGSRQEKVTVLRGKFPDFGLGEGTESGVALEEDAACVTGFETGGGETGAGEKGVDARVGGVLHAATIIRTATAVSLIGA